MISAVRQSLDSVREKIVCDERLTPKEAEGLWDDSVDLHELGELATSFVNEKMGMPVFTTLIPISTQRMFVFTAVHFVHSEPI